LLTPDCGVHYDTLFHAKGKELPTSSTETDYFRPVASNWDRVVIDLSAYENLTFASFNFSFVSGLGNNFYIDDISIFGKDAIVNVIDFENDDISVYPNPFKNDFTINLPTNEISNQITIFDASGKVVYVNNVINNNKINVSDIYSKGIYYLYITSNKKHAIKKIIKL